MKYHNPNTEMKSLKRKFIYKLRESKYDIVCGFLFGLTFGAIIYYFYI